MELQKIQALKKTLSAEVFAGLTEFFQEQVRDLNTLDQVRELSHADDQAIEVKACKKAYEKVQAIFQQIISIEGYEAPKKEKGNDFGIEE